MFRTVVALMVLFSMGCSDTPSANMTDEGTGARAARIDLQGHRGARGLLPENTIPAFVRALEIGVTTLEMDVVVDSEGTVVVSHNPWMSATICSHPGGNPVRKEEERSLLLYGMTYTEILGYDCGMRGHPSFPDQKSGPAVKPRLAEVIEVAQQFVSEHGGALPTFNIELKSSEQGDGLAHPDPSTFVQLVYDVLRGASALENSTIQSFDPRILEVVHVLDPQVSTGWLVGNEDGFEANMARLSFVPTAYSPNHNLVDAALVSSVHENGMLLVPWTVNDIDRMRELIDLGTDAIITDYPNLGRELLDELTKNAISK